MAGKITIRELVTRWGFDVDEKPLRKMESGVASLKKGLAVVGGLAAAGAASLFGLAKKTANVGDETAKTADRLGWEIEALQEMRHAADLAGISSGALEKNLRKQNRTARDAAEGSQKAADAYKLFGVNTKDSNGELKTGEQLLMEMAAGYNTVANETERAAALQDIYGRSGGEMGTLLKQGAEGIAEARKEAQRLGLVMSEETARASEEFNDTLTRIQGTAKGVALALGGDLVKRGLELAKGVQAWVEANRALIKQRVEQAIEVIISGLEIAWAVMNGLAEAVGWLIEQMGGLEKAAKIVGLVLATLITMKTIAGVQAFIGFIGALITSMRALGVAAMWANVKVMLIPAAIAALIVLIGLVIEDFHRFFNGQNSAIGELVKKYPALGDAIWGLKEAWDQVTNAFGNLFEQAPGALENFQEWLFSLGFAVVDWYETLAARIRGFFSSASDAVKDGIGGAMKWVANQITDLLDLLLVAADKIPGFGDMADKLASARNEMAAIAAGDTQMMFEAQAGGVARGDAAGGTARGGGGGNTYQGGPISVTQRPGEDGAALARRINEEQRRERERQNRKAKDAYSGGAVY